MSGFCLKIGLVLGFGAVCTEANCPCYYDGMWHDCNKSPFSGDYRCVCGTSGSDWKSPDQCKGPSPQDAPGYDKHERLDCYEGHGGLCNGGACIVQGSDIGYRADATSVDACGKTCDDDSGCSCFVFMTSQNKCFLRSQCTVAECEVRTPGDQDQFDTYTKSDPCPCIDDGKWHTCNGVRVKRSPGTCNNQPGPDQKVEVHFQSSWNPCPSSTSISGISAPLVDLYTSMRPYYAALIGKVSGNPMQPAESVKVGEAMQKCIDIDCKAFSYNMGRPVTPPDGHPAGAVTVNYFQNIDHDHDSNSFLYVPHSALPPTAAPTPPPGALTFVV